MKTLALRDFSLMVALVLLVSYFSYASSGSFISARNLSNLGVEFAVTAVLALGVFFVLLPGQNDLSTGSGVGLAGGIAAVLVFEQGWGAPAAMGVSLVVVLLSWLFMAYFVVWQRIPAFIMTLAGMLVFRGVHWLVIGSRTIPVRVGATENLLSILTTYYLPKLLGWVLVVAVSAALAAVALRERAQRKQHGLPNLDRDTVFVSWFIATQLLILLVLVMNQFNGVPLPLAVLGVVATIVQIVTRNTPFGRHLYAIGGNREAARLSGIRVERTTLIAFAICGFSVAITGFMQTAYGGGSTTTTGTLMELDAIAACCIGGVSLTGGTGKVTGVLVGALLMAVVLNGMTLLAVTPEFKQIARGIVLALAVWMDVSFARQR